MAEKLSQEPQFISPESEKISDTSYYDNAEKDKKRGGQTCQTDPQGNVEVDLKDQKGLEAKIPKHEEDSQGKEGEPRGSTGSISVLVDKPAVDSSPIRLNPAQPRSDKLEPEVNMIRHDPPLSGEGDTRRPTDSPSRQEATSLRNSFDLPVHRNGGSSATDTPRKVSRQSVGSDRQSGKGGGISSPSYERKATSDGSHGLAPLTPGRSRLRSVTRGDDSPDQSPAVPKFGDWDDTDPATEEGYTQIFERVRAEKHNETAKVPGMATQTSYGNGQKQFGNSNPKGCSCFPWSKR